MAHPLTARNAKSRLVGSKASRWIPTIGLPALAAACVLALAGCSGRGGAAAGGAASGPPTDAEVVAAFNARTERLNKGQAETLKVVSVSNRKCTPLADPSKYDCELEVETQLTPSGPPIKGTNHALLERIDGVWTTNQDVPS